MFEIIGYEPRKCPEHGDYTCEIVTTPGGDYASKCPVCMIDDRPYRQAMSEAMHNHDERRMQQRIAKSGIPPRYQSRTFDNYRTESDGQQRNFETCKRFADNFDKCLKQGSSLVLAGNMGNGKTHLACAIANQLMCQGYTAQFLCVAKMFRRIRETYRSDSCQTEQQAIDALVGVNLLIIDEVGVQRGTESEEQLLFEVLNDRYGSFKPTILISNLPLVDARKYIGTRMLDRLREGGGRILTFDWDSYRGKVLGDAELPMGDAIKDHSLVDNGRLRPFPKDD